MSARVHVDICRHHPVSEISNICVWMSVVDRDIVSHKSPLLSSSNICFNLDKYSDFVQRVQSSLFVWHQRVQTENEIIIWFNSSTCTGTKKSCHKLILFYDQTLYCLVDWDFERTMQINRNWKQNNNRFIEWFDMNTCIFDLYVFSFSHHRVRINIHNYVVYLLALHGRIIMQHTVK